MIRTHTSDPPPTKMGTPYSGASVLTNRVRWVVLALFIFIISVTPIVWFRYLPLADYQNHLARLQIHNTLSSNSYLSQFFEFHWSFIPYLGFDLFAQPFMYFLPVELVGKIVIIIVLGVIYSGTVLLDRQLNPHNWGLSLFSGIFLYNGAFKYGFMSYLVGVGVAIWAFWAWIRSRQKADGLWFLIFALIGLVVILMHLYTFAIYAVCVAGYECSVVWERFRAEGRLRMTLFRVPLIASVTLIIPVLAVILFNPLFQNNPGLEIWGNAGANFWATLVRKGEALISPIFYCEPLFEIPLVFILVGLFLWALLTNTIALNRRMIIPLAIFAIIFIFMPFGLFGSAYAYYRLPSAVIFVALASLGWGHTSPARIKFVSLLLAACLIVRVGSVFADWGPAQAIIGEYDTALRSVPPGSRIMVLVRRTFWGDRKPPLRHIPVLAAALQGVFDPRTFTDGVYPLKLKSNYRGYWIDDTAAPSSIGEFKKFDYLMVIGQVPVNTPVGLTLQEIERRQTFVLYRIEQQKIVEPRMIR